MISKKYFMPLKVHQKIFCYIIFLQCFFYSIFSFAQNAQKLYLNVLDIENVFENKLILANKNKLDYKAPVTITPTFKNETISCYELKRSYKPNKGSQLVDMDADEIYELVFFKKEHIVIDNSNIDLFSNSLYKTWFSSYHEVIIRNEATDTMGMWPFFNTENIKLNVLLVNEQDNDETDDLSQRSSEAINQLFEMASAVARQLTIQHSIKNKNVLKTLSSTDNENILIDIPEDYFLSYLLEKKHELNLTDILQIMYSIASSVEYLHDGDIAHGDIKLSNLFIKNSDVVLSNFERFSLFNSTNKLLGTKKFTFYNNIYQAPEVRYPLGIEKKWEYTNASFEGDVWSLGMLLASILYIYYPNNPDFDSLNVAPEIPKYIKDAQIKSWMFKRSPYITLISQRLLKSPIESYITIINRINNIVTNPLQLDQESKEIIEKLVSIINSCGDLNLENRPTATQIKNEISALYLELKEICCTVFYYKRKTL